MTADLLFELGTEEMPAAELPEALAALRAQAPALLEAERLGFAAVEAFATPRRLALLVRGLADRQTAETRRAIGPPAARAFDQAGNPTQAAIGFARAQGIPVAELRRVQTERGEYVAAVREIPGEPLERVLPDLLERLLAALPFSKQMRWGQGEARFVRPIRWVLALYGGRPLPLTLRGVEATATSHGHRFLAPGPFPVTSVEGYLQGLAARHVLLDPERRRAVIQEQVAEAAHAAGGTPVLDARLLETLTYMVEAPEAVLGRFPEGYLKLPRALLETPIRHHQRFVPVEADGRLLPVFVAVSNLPTEAPAVLEAMRRGYERVVRARLADADFYFREDQKVPLAERVPALRGVIFQERLGTLYDKTQRLVALVDSLAAGVGEADREAARRAALLAKADLLTGSVREFPELQGFIGGEFALASGEPQAVAQALREQYLPRVAGDRLPASILGAVLSVADRLDSVVGCLGVGLVPTGSEDPYGLRRQAQGLVAICLDTPLRLSLGALTDRALDLLADRLTEGREAVRERALEFLRGRLLAALLDRGIRPDVAEAALASGFDDPHQALLRARALMGFLARPDFEPLLITFKRVVNILPPGFEGRVDPGAFVEAEEGELHGAFLARRERVVAALRGEAYEAALAELAALRPHVDRFFTGVMVMVEDLRLQQNRLALLAEIGTHLLAVGDLRRLQLA